MPKKLQKCLELIPDHDSQLFHTFAIDAEIAVAGAGRRTKVNCLRGLIKKELHVIDEAEQQAGELIMQVGFVFFNEFGAG